MMRALVIILVLFLSLPALAITHPDERLADPALEARAMALTKELRCVVCQNESIEESRADMARDLRILVRNQIQEGKSNADIRAFLTSKYGDFIFLKPPVSPRTYLLWLAPICVLTIGGVMIAASTRRRKIRKS